MGSRLSRIKDWEQLVEQAQYIASALAKTCGVSERHLRRYIRTTFGLSATEWIDRIRMAKGIRLICQGNPVKEVAFQLGFKQVSHFSRKFKAAYGQSPVIYLYNRRECPPRITNVLPG
jgi:AraC-like DNA-binding protein